MKFLGTITLSLDVCTNEGEIKHFMINQNASGEVYIEKIKVNIFLP